MVPNGWTQENFQTLKISIVDGDRGKNYPKKTDYHSEGYSLFLGADNVADGKLNLYKCIFLTKEKHESMGKGIAREDDILLVMRGNGTGRSCIYRGEIKSFQARINSGLVIIRHNKEFTNIEFLHQLFQSPLIQKQFEGYMFGSAQPQLTIQLLKSLRFCIPKLEEQKKIAQILSTWDQAITATEQLLTNSQQQKKALMQQLLTGKKRLLDENGVKFSGEWTRGHIKDCAECLDNKRVPLNSEQRSQMSGAIPYWGANGIVDYVSEFIFDETIVLLAEDGGYFDEYQTRPIANISHGKCWVNNHAHILRAKTNCTNEWLYFSLVHKNILGFVNGGTRAKLNKSDMLMISLYLPSIDEQRKIATVLSTADQEIAALQKKLVCLKQEKKALMQQLLTGKRRVLVN